MFFVLYRHTDDGIFDDFPQISDHFPKILQNLSAGHPNIAEHVPKNFQRLPKIAGDFRERLEEVSITHQRF